MGDYCGHSDYRPVCENCEIDGLKRVNSDLLEALEHCADVMADPWKHGDQSISQAIAKARAVLARAKGEN